MIFKGLVARIEIYFLAVLYVRAECGPNYDVITESKEFVEMFKLNVTCRGHEEKERGQTQS